MRRFIIPPEMFAFMPLNVSLSLYDDPHRIVGQCCMQCAPPVGSHLTVHSATEDVQHYEVVSLSFQVYAENEMQMARFGEQVEAGAIEPENRGFVPYSNRCIAYVRPTANRDHA